jgi:hypothetical protein
MQSNGEATFPSRWQLSMSRETVAIIADIRDAFLFTGLIHGARKVFKRTSNHRCWKRSRNLDASPRASRPWLNAARFSETREKLLPRAKDAQFQF